MQYDYQGVTCRGDDGASETWDYARDVRATAIKAQKPDFAQKQNNRKYPSFPEDSEKNMSFPPDPNSAIPDMNIPPHYMHTPHVRGEAPREYWNKRQSSKGYAGRWRAVYNESDHTRVESIFHDPHAPPDRAGRAPFSRAPHVPAGPRTAVWT